MFTLLWPTRRHSRCLHKVPACYNRARGAPLSPARLQRVKAFQRAAAFLHISFSHGTLEGLYPKHKASCSDGKAVRTAPAQRRPLVATSPACWLYNRNAKPSPDSISTSRVRTCHCSSELSGILLTQLTACQPTRWTLAGWDPALLLPQRVPQPDSHSTQGCPPNSPSNQAFPDGNPQNPSSLT